MEKFFIFFKIIFKDHWFIFFALTFENRSNSALESRSRQMKNVPDPLTLSYETPAFLDTIGTPFKKGSRSVKINVNLFLLHTVEWFCELT